MPKEFPCTMGWQERAGEFTLARVAELNDAK